MAGKRKFDRATIIDSVLARIAKGEPLAAICRAEGMPSVSSVYDWLEEDKSMAARFARAREEGFDAIAAECLAISDTPPAYATGDGGMRIDGGDIQHRKLQIETRLKLLAKWDPKRYGDKLEVGGPGSGGAILIQAVTGVPGADPEG